LGDGEPLGAGSNEVNRNQKRTAQSGGGKGQRSLKWGGGMREEVCPSKRTTARVKELLETITSVEQNIRNSLGGKKKEPLGLHQRSTG